MNTSDTEISTIERLGVGNTLLHVFMSWFLGIVMAVILALLYSVIHGSNNLLNASNIRGVFELLFLFLLFGIPSLLIGWLLFLLVNSVVPSANLRFILWFIAVIASITINMIMLGGGFSLDMIDMFWQLYAGAAIGLLIRTQQFLRLTRTPGGTNQTKLK